MKQNDMKAQVRYLQNLFHALLDDFGQVFVVVKYSEKTTIGNRGFTEEEKESGLVLVFNQQNYSKFRWMEDGSVMATLGFGTRNRPEKCLIHHDDILSVFSPKAGVRFDRWDMWEEPHGKETGDSPETRRGPTQEGKVVSLNGFRKTKK